MPLLLCLGELFRLLTSIRDGGLGTVDFMLQSSEWGVMWGWRVLWPHIHFVL